MKRTILCLALAACGGKPTPAPAKPADHAAEEQKEMANLPVDLAKFHDVLAPRWHADKGPQRMKDTCAAIAAFQAGADQLASSPPPPAAKVDDWGQESKELVDAVAGLKTTCDGNDAAGFEPAFAHVHQEFHELLETLEPEKREPHAM